MALLLTLFIFFVVSNLVVHILDTEMLQQSALRNTNDYEKALYLANAGVHHAAAELEQNSNWRGTVTDGGFPASGSYSATASDGVAPGTVDIASAGVSGAITRRLSAVAEIN